MVIHAEHALCLKTQGGGIKIKKSLELQFLRMNF